MNDTAVVDCPLVGGLRFFHVPNDFDIVIRCSRPDGANFAPDAIDFPTLYLKRDRQNRWLADTWNAAGLTGKARERIPMYAMDYAADVLGIDLHSGSALGAKRAYERWIAHRAAGNNPSFVR